MADNNLYDINRMALPQDSKQTLGTKLPNNFALLFNRMAHFANKEDLSEMGDIGSLISKEIKAHFFHKSKKGKDPYHLDLTKKWEISPDQRTHYKLFLDEHTAAIQALYPGCQPFILKSDWRIALGMGNESVYENGFTFHPTLGIPYLPGSSLKGMTRHWAVATGKSAGEITAIFGHENDIKVNSEKFQQGQIVFFDALPTELNQGMVQPDIMNNHYPEYYAGEKYPADWLSPRPIFFLTMKDVSFQFCLGYIPRTGATDGVALLKTAQAWLKSALEESGVGAKTAVGYGRMRTLGATYVPPSLDLIGQDPTFKEGKSDKKLKNRDELQARITKQGRPCEATVFGYSPNTYEKIKVSGNVANLSPGTIIKVQVQVDKSGKAITSASLNGIIYQPKNP